MYGDLSERGNIEKSATNEIVSGDTFQMYYQRPCSEQNCKSYIQTETKLIF